jgi:hypothetical protein
MAEDAGPSQEEPVAEEPVAAVRRGVRGSGGRMRGFGKRVISRHPSPTDKGIDNRARYLSTPEAR